MQQKDRFVPICDVNKLLVLLESPPPYREKLLINETELANLLIMVGAQNDDNKLSFERRQPVVHATPPHPGRLAVADKTTPFKEDKNQRPRFVMYDTGRQELRLKISYPDNEVQTPKTAAVNLSRRMTEALLQVPAVKYSAHFVEDLRQDPISGRAGEAAVHLRRAFLTTIGAPICYRILEVGTGSPQPWDTLGIIAVANLVDAALDLRCAMKLIDGQPVSKKEMPFAITIAQNTLRALYPASLVQECLLPTARFVAHQSANPTQLFRAGG